MIFEELPFCHFPPLNTSILGRDSKISLIFHLNIFSFLNKRKTTILFPSPLTFLQLPIKYIHTHLIFHWTSYNFSLAEIVKGAGWPSFYLFLLQRSLSSFPPSLPCRIFFLHLSLQGFSFGPKNPARTLFSKKATPLPPTSKVKW